MGLVIKSAPLILIMDFFEKMRLVENRFLLKIILNKDCKSKRMLVLSNEEINNLFGIFFENVSNKGDKNK